MKGRVNCFSLSSIRVDLNYGHGWVLRCSSKPKRVIQKIKEGFLEQGEVPLKSLADIGFDWWTDRRDEYWGREVEFKQPQGFMQLGVGGGTEFFLLLNEQGFQFLAVD